MSHQSDLIATDIDAYLKQHEQKELLRLLTCGSVDDGKSTLIGRLLHDSKMIYEDQLSAIKADSVKSGTTGGIDLALLVDGLQAEREQGITIDVAYRYFSTAKRKFIIADTPGHEQYTRNMVTGASTCDLAIILIDARYGVKTQTRRHGFIASLLGIKHVIVAVNKMDLVNYDQAIFDAICADFLTFSAQLNLSDIRYVPISALNGDNVVHDSEQMRWYRGESMMQLLECIQIANDQNFEDMRFPVQYVNRPNLDFRGYCGTVASGVLKPGEDVVVLPSRKTSRIRSLVTYDGELSEAFPPMAVTVTLEDDIDVSRGDVLAYPSNQPSFSDHFDATVVWMSEQPMSPGKQYEFKHGTRYTTGIVTRIEHSIDVNTLEKNQQVRQLGLNEIAVCQIRLNAPIAFDSYQRSKLSGSFIVVDRLSNVTVGAGMIIGEIDEQTQTIAPVSAEEYANRYGQRPGVIVLRGEDKELAARKLERLLFNKGLNCVVLAQPVLDASPEVTASAVVSIVGAGLICVCGVKVPETDGLIYCQLATDQVLNNVGLDTLFNRFSLESN